MPPTEHSRLFYIKHVTMGEFASEFGTRLIYFLLIAGIWDGVMLAMDFGLKALGWSHSKDNPSEFAIWLKSVPIWVWCVIFFAYIIWTRRGTTFKIDFPNLSFVEWLCVVALSIVLAMSMSMAYIPDWISFPVAAAEFQLLMGYNDLAKLGRENLEERAASLY